MSPAQLLQDRIDAVARGRGEGVRSPRDDARMAEIIALVNAGHLRPNLHEIFDFDALPEAHALMRA